MKILDKPIQAIISFSISGDMLPLWIKFEENAELVTYKVEEIISHMNEGINHITFVCSIVEEMRRQLVELRYNKPSCRWMLYRVLS